MTPPAASNASAQGYVADPRNERVLVYVDGAFVPRDQAVVSIFDSGFVLGVAGVEFRFRQRWT